MARDERGRFFPGFDDDGRHPLSLLDCRKGFEAAMRKGVLPSRLRAWLRSKIRRQYQEKAKRRRERNAS